MRKTAAVLLAAIGFVVSGAVTAFASCAAPEGTFRDRLNRGVAVFVGFVNQTSNNGRTAKVTIQEVWRPGDLAISTGPAGTVAEVNGNPLTEATDPNVSTSIDRHYKQGIPYLFVPDVGNRGTDGVFHFRESACSPTTEFTRGVERYRPFTVERAAASIPDRAPEPRAPLPDWLRTAIVVALACLSAALAFGRRWTAQAQPTA